MLNDIEGLLFSAIIIVWEENHPPNANVFYPIFASCVHVFHQIVAHLPQSATERARISQNVQFFSEKIDGLFSKQSVKFSRIAKGGNFAVEFVSNGIIS